MSINSLDNKCKSENDVQNYNYIYNDNVNFRLPESLIKLVESKKSLPSISTMFMNEKNKLLSIEINRRKNRNKLENEEKKY